MRLIKNVLIFLVFAAVIVFSNESLVAVSKQYPRKLLQMPKSFSYFHFGYRELLADLLWIRAIQDFDYCEPDETAQRAEKKENLNKLDIRTLKSIETKEDLSFEVHADKSLDKTLLEDSQPAICKGKGWLFSVLDLGSEYAPRFKSFYILGGLNLSVLTDDREGATLIYEKGMVNIPDEWSIPYQAAYHALFNLKDPAKAAEYLDLAGKKGAPEWVHLLASRLYSKVGQSELALRVLQGFLEAKPEYLNNPRVQQRLKAIELLDKTK